MTTIAADLAMFSRFARGLRRFLGEVMTPEQCGANVRESVARREEVFLRLLKRAVFEQEKSPYRKLFRWAGAEFGDLAKQVRADGVEAALAGCYDAGVHIKLDEFKGKMPIERHGLSIACRAEDFDNPLLARDFEVATSGSTGKRRRLATDFGLLSFDTGYRYLLLEAHGVAKQPNALWRPVPPGSAGLKNALMAAKCGNPCERWFSPSRVDWSAAMWKSALFTTWAVRGSRGAPYGIPAPEYVPLSEPTPVARWLAEKVDLGAPGVISLPVSCAVRAVQAALDQGIGIAGSVLRLGGEPYTEAKARLFERAGVRAFPQWAMAETGPLGGACAHPLDLDELHIYRGKVAVLPQPVVVAATGEEIQALHLTTLLPATPKIMINVDSGDTGVITNRRCGCLLDEMGMTHHVHRLYSYEKLTTGGMQLVASEILELIESVLPAAHGGGPSDYQLVDEQTGTLNRAVIVVSPRVPDLSDDALRTTVLRYVARSSRGGRMMARYWEDGESFRVVREEPFATSTGKVPPLRSARANGGSVY